MNGPIRRVAIIIFAAFALLLLNVTYVQVVAGPRYRDDPRNPRVLLSRTGKERGLIIAADNTVLAESVPELADPGVFTRSYPEGPAFAHVVGFSSLLFGDRGIEEAHAGELRSRRDLTVSDLVSALLGRDLRPRSLQLTVEPALQRIAYEALGSQAGAVVALQPETGAVLALVSKPSYDPNTLLGAAARGAGEALTADPTRPLLNRATGESYPPGSTFKPVVAAAALETGQASPEASFPDPAELELPGSTAVIRNYGGGTCGGGTEISLRDAFAQSCNTVFGLLAMQVGAALLAEQADEFGFNQAVPFEWEVLPSVFPPAENFSNDLPALAQSGIGQRDVRTTPLQMALVAAAIANDGLIMVPHLVQRTFDADGNVISVRQPAIYRRAVSPATAQVLGGLMERVVTSGTGRRASVPGVRVAGKTGTAETTVGAPHAWFIGFAPVEQPTIAVAVLVEAGGQMGESATGGSLAAPIAAQLLGHWLQNSP